MTKHTVTAIIYDRKGKVLSVGKNNYTKSHPLQARHAGLCNVPYKIFLHAEVHAVTQLSYFQVAHSILVSRYNSKGEPVNARPCSICKSLLDEVGIREIRHT